MEDKTARRMALYAIILAALVIVLAAKTQFTGGVSTIEEAFVNSIFYADGGHIHDDQDLDGHAPKIDGRWHVSWGVPAAKNPAGELYRLQCVTDPAIDGAFCSSALSVNDLADDIWQLANRYVTGGPEILFMRSATLTPQICAACQIVNRGANDCRGGVKLDFISLDGGEILDAALIMTTGTTALESADANSATSSMIVAGQMNNPYSDDGGSKTGGRAQGFYFKFNALTADGGTADLTCKLGLYWCTIWECDTDAGTQAGPAW